MGLRLLDILEVIHKSGIVYNDLKLDNILLGQGQFLPRQAVENCFKHLTLNLVDFGLASEWIDSGTGRHCEPRKTLNFSGNLIFSSVNQLKCNKTSRSDDLHSLAYLLLFIMNRGTLPGLDQIFNSIDQDKVADYDDPAVTVMKLKALMELKEAYSLTDWCQGRRVAHLYEFCAEVQQYRFSSEPNYARLRSILMEKVNNEAIGHFQIDSENSGFKANDGHQARTI